MWDREGTLLVSHTLSSIAHLEIVLGVYVVLSSEDVPHDHEIRLRSIDGQTEHSEELQTRKI